MSRFIQAIIPSKAQAPVALKLRRCRFVSAPIPVSTLTSPHPAYCRPDPKQSEPIRTTDTKAAVSDFLVLYRRLVIGCIAGWQPARSIDEYRPISSNIDQSRPKNVRPITALYGLLRPITAIKEIVPPVSRALDSEAPLGHFHSLSFCGSVLIRVHPGLNDFSTTNAHRTAQFLRVFAPMCTSVHLRAPLCGKTEKSEMVHKPHIPAHSMLLAPTCIKLHQLAGKKIARSLTSKSCFLL
jgi:hypothetical protein